MKQQKKRPIEVWEQKQNNKYEHTSKAAFYALICLFLLIFTLALYGYFTSNK